MSALAADCPYGRCGNALPLAIGGGAGHHPGDTLPTPHARHTYTVQFPGTKHPSPASVAHAPPTEHTTLGTDEGSLLQCCGRAWIMLRATA